MSERKGAFSSILDLSLWDSGSWELRDRNITNVSPHWYPEHRSCQRDSISVSVKIMTLITRNGGRWHVYVFLITIDLALWWKSLEQLLAVQTWELRKGTVPSPCKGTARLMRMGFVPIFSRANEEWRGCPSLKTDQVVDIKKCNKLLTGSIIS